MINEFITDICELLNIEAPAIAYDDSHFATDTMMAQCSSDGDTIFLRRNDKPNPDYYFAITHELRHIWQIRNDKAYYFDSYQTIDKIGTDAYNNQIAEIDAHAFATIVMVDMFRLQPQYNGLSAGSIERIKERVTEIVKSFQ